MKIIDVLKKMNKKQKTITIMTTILSIIVIIGLTMIIVSRNKKSNAVENFNFISEDVVPDVTEENTKFAISSFEEAENITITVEEKLEEYQLYYLVEKKESVILEESEKELIEDTTGYIEKIDKNDFTSYILYEEPILIEENSKVYFIYEKDATYSNEIYTIEINNIVKALQETEEVSEEQLEAEKVDKSKMNNKAPYYIKVNYGANTVTIYGKDEEGSYTVPVKAMICSCGISTPKGGVYKTSRGYEWGSLIGGVYGQYSTRIVGSILFHSVPYTAPAKDALEYWEFDKLGTKASAGCVRLMVSDAQWIFYNCGSGTMVEFYSSDDPGPLGKPSAPKISNNEKCRNWDPTDNAPGNPWFEKEENPQEVIDNIGDLITDDTILED